MNVDLGIEERPTIDGATEGIVARAVDEVLELAQTWLAWDGTPIVAEGNVWTPLKALRRVQDHLVDHLAEIELRLAGRPTIPDRWHGRSVTLDSDWSHFTELDLDEATSRLTRLAQTYEARVGSLSAETLDRDDGTGAWTLREVVHHVADVNLYARFVGRLA